MKQMKYISKYDSCNACDFKKQIKNPWWMGKAHWRNTLILQYNETSAMCQVLFKVITKRCIDKWHLILKTFTNCAFTK